MKVGIIREGKTPPDKRVALTPNQCVQIQKQYPSIEIVAQESLVRKIKDKAYADNGISIVEDVSDCDILIGVKEVNKEDLIPNKTYLFFSHTYKKQPYNRDLLNEILKQKIRLIDYEVLTNKRGLRLIGFGRYAGIVGAYNGFLAYGKKHQLFNLKPANECEDRTELEQELKKIQLPNDTKIVLTGLGRVGQGAREIFNTIGMKEVDCKSFLEKAYNEPVYTQLDIDQYYKRADGKTFDKSSFYKNGEGHVSLFKDYLSVANMYIACHYWSSSSPFIYTREDLKIPNLKLSVVADISCDIDGPVASTIRPSTIADPLYGYNPTTEQEEAFNSPNSIGIMAVDNLPCELPKDASEDFGNELIKHILPSLFGADEDQIIARASETNLKGELSDYFKYLEPYCRGEE